MYANIVTICPVCGTRQKVKVYFKDCNHKFETISINCIFCNTELKVEDKNNLPNDKD